MIRVLFILSIFAAWASAQDVPAIQTKILTYALGGLPEEFTGFYKNGGQIMMFRASDGTLGVPIRYKGPRRFVLLESEKAFDAAAEGQQPPTPIASVDLPENASTVLVLAAPTDGKAIRLLAYDISPGSLGKGEYRMFNFSHSELSMVFGNRRFVLPAGRDAVVRDESWKQKIMTFPIKIATVKENRAKPVYSNFWEHHPSSRTLLFLFSGSRPNQAIRFMDFAVDAAADNPQEL